MADGRQIAILDPNGLRILEAPGSADLLPDRPDVPDRRRIPEQQ